MRDIAKISLLFVFGTLFSCFHKPSTLSAQKSNIDSIFSNPVYTETFESIDQNQLERDWLQAITGKNVKGKWEIINENGNKSVGQVSDKSSGYLFNLIVLKKLSLKNLAITASVKAIAGKEDQGGGVVWRYQDSANYYVARVNPLENNFRVYKVINGNREQIQSYSLPVTAKEWHDITVVQRDSLIECYFDHQLFLKATDNAINLPGKVGFWTKADAQTHFDNFMVKELK